MSRTFDDLVAEAVVQPVDDWSFEWLAGRATEERPSWHYFDLVKDAVERCERMLDIETGTGNLLADLPALPPLTVATDAWRPSLAIAGPRLRPRGAHVVEATTALPFRAGAFDLVVSRHPVSTDWGEVARVVAHGGRVISQQIGPRSLGELSDALLGPRPPRSNREPGAARDAVARSGLVVERLEGERTAVAFHDIGAVVYFLRLVPWIVPDFAVDRFARELRALHDHIERAGSFEATSSRFLVVAHRP